METEEVFEENEINDSALVEVEEVESIEIEEVATVDPSDEVIFEEEEIEEIFEEEVEEAQVEPRTEIVLVETNIEYDSEKGSEEDFTEVTTGGNRAESEENLRVPGEVNSESFIVPEYNPAMEAYAKKPKKEPVNRKKRKKRSFIRSVRKKITVYLRKLTLSDIGFMDED